MQKMKTAAALLFLYFRKGKMTMATTRLMALQINKGQTAADSLKERLDYIENPEKTKAGELVTSFACYSKTAQAEFNLQKKVYFQRKGHDKQSNVIAYHIRQSFKPGEITPEEANRVGYETAMRWTKGKYPCIVAIRLPNTGIADPDRKIYN